MNSPSRRTWFALVGAAIAVLGVIAAVAGMWQSLGASEISAAGWGAMILGVLATLALGMGLMALVFISNRRGYDDPDRRS